MGLLLALLGLSNLTGCSDATRHADEICKRGLFTEKQQEACEVGVKLAHQGHFQNPELISNRLCSVTTLRRHLKLSRTEDVTWAKTTCVHGFLEATRRKSASNYVPAKEDTRIVQRYITSPDQKMSLSTETVVGPQDSSKVSLQ